MRSALKIHMYDGDVTGMEYTSNDAEPLIVKVGYEAPVLVDPQGGLETWRETVNGLCIYSVPVAVAMKWPIENADTLEERVIEHARGIAIQQGMHLEPFNHQATFQVAIDGRNYFQVYLHYHEEEE